MRYSTWFTVEAVLLLVVFLVLLAVFANSPVGVGPALFIGALMLLAFFVAVTRMRRAIGRYGGTPMGGIWGAAGFDVVPDDLPAPGDRSPGARNSDPPATPGTAVPIAVGGPGAADRRPGTTCPFCGTVTVGTDSAFCRRCGRRLDGID